MRRPRITITLNSNILQNLDKLVDGKKIRNRSHAIEYVLSNFFKPTVSKAVILAGGKGDEKSLLPIKGKPILEYIINNLKKNQINQIIICTGHLGDKIKKYFGNGQKFGVEIAYSEEGKNLMTGGALNKAKKYLGKEPFLVVHGDVLTDFHVKDMINFHLEHNALATIALTTVGHPTEFGQLKLHGVNIVRFYQKQANIESHLVNCGIYVLEPTIFQYFPKQKEFLLEDVIEKLINKSLVNGFVYEGQWYDVGSPKNYEKAIKAFRLPNLK